ncbi:glycosyltransferase, partial [Enterococcus faecium]|nr:glycosyltransferase [Enterococcus faecium]
MYSVTVFMSTYNSEMYLEEQIKSILKQKKVKVSLWVRDDGSSDNTINILEKYKKKGKLTYFSGCNLGYGKSFLDLFKNIKIPTDYYAYSDQDDYWEE